LTAELALTSNRSAAARRDAPPSIASITRSRKSSDNGFGIDRSPDGRQCRQNRSSSVT
jgi:hypothetical protein